MLTLPLATCIFLNTNQCSIVNALRKSACDFCIYVLNFTPCLRAQNKVKRLHDSWGVMCLQTLSPFCSLPSHQPGHKICSPIKLVTADGMCSFSKSHIQKKKKKYARTCAAYKADEQKQMKPHRREQIISLSSSLTMPPKFLPVISTSSAIKQTR